jgi:hypothetical protein
MEAARTSETLVNFYQTSRRYNPEDSHLRTHRRENFKSYLFDLNNTDIRDMKISTVVYSVVTLCSIVGGCQRIGGTCRLRFQGLLACGAA